MPVTPDVSGVCIAIAPLLYGNAVNHKEQEPQEDDRVP
jgi:hypothetical protein